MLSCELCPKGRLVDCMMGVISEKVKGGGRCSDLFCRWESFKIRNDPSSPF